MPRGGFRGQNLGHLKKWFSAFLLCKQFMKVLSRTLVNLMTLTCVSWNEGRSSDFVFYLEDLFDGLMSNFWIVSQPIIWPQINVGHSEGLNVVFNDFSVLSWRCLVATGSSTLTFIVLPHWSIMPQTLDMIPHPVTLTWHWVDQS